MSFTFMWIYVFLINILFYYHLLIGNLKTGAELICHKKVEQQNGVSLCIVCHWLVIKPSNSHILNLITRIFTIYIYQAVISFFIPQIRTWATESSSGCKSANFKCRSIYFSFLGALKFLKFFFLILFRFFNLSDRIALSCHNFCDLFRFYTLVQVHFSLHYYIGM